MNGITKGYWENHVQIPFTPGLYFWYQSLTQFLLSHWFWWSTVAWSQVRKLKVVMYLTTSLNCKMINFRITLNISQWTCEEPQMRRHCDVAMNFDGEVMSDYEQHDVAITLDQGLWGLPKEVLIRDIMENTWKWRDLYHGLPDHCSIHVHVDHVLFVFDLHMKYTVEVVPLCLYIMWFVSMW